MRFILFAFLAVVFLANIGCYDYAQASADREAKVEADAARLEKEMEVINKPITATIRHIYGGLQLTGVPEHHSMHSSSHSGMFSRSSSRSESFSNETVKLDSPLVLYVETNDHRFLSIEVIDSDTATRHSLYPFLKERTTRIKFPAGSAKEVWKRYDSAELTYYPKDMDTNFVYGVQAGKKLANRIIVLNPEK